MLMQDEIDINHSLLIEKAGKGNEFLGWIDLPGRIEETLIKAIEDDAKDFREKAEIIVVIGIGGSYLGSRAVSKRFRHLFLRLKTTGKIRL